MKKTTKFLFGFASTILMATGCQLAPTTPTKTAEEKVTEAQNLLVYSGLNGVTGNFELIQSVAGLEDVKITYTVSTPAVDYLAVEGTTMKVTRPKFTEGDKSFAPGFTATFTLDDVTKTKDFNVKILALPEENKELTLVTNPVKDTNYKIGFTNATETKFFNGEMSSFYGATASHPYYGVDVQLKETTGGYHLTFVDAKGKTQYIAVAVTTNEKGTHTNFVFAETPAADGAVWTYDAANNTVITTLGGERHWIGGAGTYTTFDMYNDEEKEAKDFYPAQFYTYTGGAPVVTDKPTAATSLSTEKEYNLGMEIAEQKLVYFTGSMAQYYGASSETRSEGVVTKVETAENGYYLSFMKGSDKKYIGAEASDGHLNFKIHNEAKTVWTWDATYNTLTTTLGEEKVYIGTYGSYSTFGVSKYSTIESSYPAHFYEIGGTTETPDNPGTDTPAATEPAPVETTIAALVANAPTEDAAQIYIVTGTWETKDGQDPATNKYGNGKLLDGENSVTIYGLGGSKSVLTYAEGKYTYKNAQDFLTLNVVDGTKVKVGMVYSAQYKNYSAYLIEIVEQVTPSEPETPVEPEDPTPETPATPATKTIAEVLEIGLGLEQLATTTEQYTVTGTVDIVGSKYYLTDGTNRVQLYNGSFDNLHQGYTATVTGKIQLYYNQVVEIVEFTVGEVIPCTYSITIPSFENGSVTVSTTTNIAYGTEVTFTVTPASGYATEYVKVNGTAQTVGTDGTFKYTVTRDASVEASFISASQAVTTVASCDFTTKASNHNSYIDSWKYDTNWTISGGANNNGAWDYIKLGGKASNLATLNDIYIASSQINSTVSRITVDMPAGSFSKAGMSCPTWGVYVYSDEAMTQQVDYVEGAAITTTANSYTFEPTSGTSWASGCYYKIVFNVENTSTTNGIVLVSKVNFLNIA